MRAFRVLGILVLAVTVGFACARPAEPESPAPGELESTTIDLEDAGGTVTVGVGERLVLALDPIDGQAWMVIQYPEDVLAPESTDGPAVGRVFTARAAGQGEIVAFNRAGCGPTQLRYPCPAGGPAKPPGTRFTVTVVVTA